MFCSRTCGLHVVHVYVGAVRHRCHTEGMTVVVGGRCCHVRYPILTLWLCCGDLQGATPSQLTSRLDNEVPPPYTDALRDVQIPTPVEIHHRNGTQDDTGAFLPSATVETSVDAVVRGSTAWPPLTAPAAGDGLSPPYDLPPAYVDLSSLWKLIV